MKLYSQFLISCLLLLAMSCKTDINQLKKEISLQSKDTYKLSEDLKITLNNPKNHQIDQIEYFLDGEAISESHSLTSERVGQRQLEAKVFIEGESFNLSKEITIFSDKIPEVYTFEIVNTYPHDINAYTQGLEFHNGELYESTGQYRESELRKVDFKTGEVLQSIELEDQFFGEGLTIKNDQIFQLTWRENIGFVYDLTSFDKKSTFKYNQSKEGWGICHNDEVLFKSDGSEKIWILDPETQKEQSYLQAFHHKGKTIGLNELEFIDGKIYANRYQLNGVAIINAENGAIEGVIDFSALKEKVTQHTKLDVLNGIAYHPERQTIFVTGKYWDKLFEVTISKK